MIPRIPGLWEPLRCIPTSFSWDGTDPGTDGTKIVWRSRLTGRIRVQNVMTEVHLSDLTPRADDRDA